MFEQLQNWKGAIEINSTYYNSIQDVEYQADGSSLCIVLHNESYDSEETLPESFGDLSGEYVITVKQYMTKKSTSDFDFMLKWNEDNPMPLRTMIGTKEKETKGMVYMKLHGDIIARQVPCCMKCGKPLTNSVSQFFGMGPECGGHNYVNPFESDEELELAVERYRKDYLQNITWEGWIIKSAIINEEKYER